MKLHVNGKVTSLRKKLDEMIACHTLASLAMLLCFISIIVICNMTFSIENRRIIIMTIDINKSDKNVIPKELQISPQWVLSKPDKNPYQTNGQKAKSNEPATWNTFENIFKVFQNGGYNCMGYVLTNGDPFCVIDLDNCRNLETGEIAPEAKKIINDLDSYTEISQSGKGVHIFIKGKKPGGKCRNKTLEMYDSGRFIAMTFNHLDGTLETIESRQDELNDLYHRNFPQEDNKKNEKPSDPKTLCDKKIYALISKAKNRDKIEKLLKGDCSDYPSQSEADLALCCNLAFYTQDVVQIDRLFRKSNLYREKWEREDYRDQTIEKALQSITEHYQPNQKSSTESKQNQKYRETESGIMLIKHTKDGDVGVPLCNFNAKIIEEVTLDDGSEKTTIFNIKGKMASGNNLPTAHVPANRFANMSWVTENWGTSAIVEAGFSSKDHLRSAIQHISNDKNSVQRRTVYTFTGWKKIDGVYFFLHSDGAIGANDSVNNINTELEEKLSSYQFPNPPTGENLINAVRTSLRLLELIPPNKSYPSMAAVYRPPLGEADTVDYSIFYAGPTGVMKSELTALLQMHFGKSFERTQLPSNFHDTANSREKKAFLAKDVIFVVDDFAPAGTSYDIARFHKEADRLFRSQGNKSGRARMSCDGSLRTEYYPRGLIVSSGEDIPRGQSIRGRMMIIEITPGDVDKTILTELQKNASEGLFALAMAGFIQWLAPRIEELKETLPDRRRTLRNEIVSNLPHSRTTDIIASLLSGWELFLQFAQEVGAITEDESRTHQQLCEQSLCELGKTQSEHIESEEPTQRFVDLLRTAFVSGNAHLSDTNTGDALNDEQDINRWGWKKVMVGTGLYGRDEWRPLGECIGWLEGDNIFLEQGAAFKCIQKIAREQEKSLGIGEKTLWKRLKEKRLLASHDPDRNTIRKTIAGTRRSVIHLKSNTLYPTENVPIVPSEPQGNKSNDLWHDNMARKSDTIEKPYQQNVPFSKEIESNGAVGTIGTKMIGDTSII